jgi:hypothetical protein
MKTITILLLIFAISYANSAITNKNSVKNINQQFGEAFIEYKYKTNGYKQCDKIIYIFKDSELNFRPKGINPNITNIKWSLYNSLGVKYASTLNEITYKFTELSTIKTDKSVDFLTLELRNNQSDTVISKISIIVYDFYIDMNNEDITNKNKTVSVGDPIYVKVLTLPSSIPTSIFNVKWDIDGYIVGGYNLDNNSSKIVQIDYMKSKIKFYWFNSIQNANIIANITPIDNVNDKYTKSTIFQVQSPVISLNVDELTDSRIYSIADSDYWVQLSSLTPLHKGIFATCRITDYKNCKGSIKWLQIVETTQRIRTAPPNFFGAVLSGHHVLDGTYPYRFGISEVFSDSPGSYLSKLASREIIHDSFLTYPMFVSNVNDSIPIPLKELKWYWKAICKVETSIPLDKWDCNDLLVKNDHTISAEISDVTTLPSYNGNVLSLNENVNFINNVKIPYIQGKVLINNGGLPLVIINSNNDNVSTSNSGEYNFPINTVGKYTMTPSLKGYTFNPVSIEVNVISLVNDINNINFTATKIP